MKPTQKIKLKKSKVSNLDDLEMKDRKGGTSPGTDTSYYTCFNLTCGCPWTAGCETNSCISNNNPPGCWSYPQCCG